MKAELSALMDDALDETDAASTLDDLSRDASLRQDWETWHRIGDSLRQGSEPVSGLSLDFTNRVMAALDDEPTVLAPRALPRRASPLRFALPLAASVMGVGAVAWVANALQSPRTPGAVVAMQKAAPQMTSAGTALGPVSGVGSSVQTVSYAGASVRVQPVGQMREYVVAHEGYSPWVAVQGAARYQGGMSEPRQDGAQ
ncbi:MAG: sigma-E factor negative regulatory protein [Rhodocyclaceae bacterium]|nr:sigma-E factor negative regulatory protein [Rhodocyclaceae bacterium]